MKTVQGGWCRRTAPPASFREAGGREKAASDFKFSQSFPISVSLKTLEGLRSRSEGGARAKPLAESWTGGKESEGKRKIWMENILENQAKTGPSTHMGPAPHTAPPSAARAWTSSLAGGEAKTEEAQGRGQGSQRPWQARFMIWLSWGEREAATIHVRKSSPVFPRRATVPKAGASIWPCCVVHLSPWSPGPGGPPFCHL